MGTIQLRVGPQEQIETRIPVHGVYLGSGSWKHHQSPGEARRSVLAGGSPLWVTRAQSPLKRWELRVTTPQGKGGGVAGGQSGSRQAERAPQAKKCRS